MPCPRATSICRRIASRSPDRLGTYRVRPTAPAIAATRSANGEYAWSARPWSSLMKSMPPRANCSASCASRAGGTPCGFSAEQVSARPNAPARRRRPSMPLSRAAERGGEIGRDVHVQQHDILVQRGIAEHHVEELPGLQPGGGGGEADAHLEHPAAAVLDRLPPAPRCRAGSPARRWRGPASPRSARPRSPRRARSIEAASDRMRYVAVKRAVISGER